MPTTVDQRRFRRTRLKRAMEPILQLFGCTQMEAAGHVATMIRDNQNLTQRNESLNQQVESWERIVKELQQK